MRASWSRTITGWVRNLPDRRVEMIAEGDDDELQQFVDEICVTTYGNVTELTVEKSKPTGEFQEFEILL